MKLNQKMSIDEPKQLIPLTVPIVNKPKAKSSKLPALQRITKSLYQLNGIKKNNERLWDRKSLCSIWYGMAGEDLAHAFKAQPGYKLVINGESIAHLGQAVNSLLHFADYIAIRDTRVTNESVTIALMPGWELYDRAGLPKSETPILLKQIGKSGAWSSTVEKVEGFGQGVWALYMPEEFSDDIYDWLFKDGRALHETGRVIFAPMIPDQKTELEFLRNGVSLPEQFGADSLWTNKFDFIDEDHIRTLSLLEIPYLKNVKLDDLIRIRQDNEDEFSRFSRSILNAVQSMKSSSEDEDFLKECRRIQRDLIDDNVDKLNIKLSQIAAMRFAGAAGIVIGATGLSFSAINGASLPMLVSGVSSLTAGSIAVAASEFKERFGLSENPMKFLWRLRSFDTR